MIMYLRLPWIVGNAGLYVALGIILAAHVISVTTGLSVSSIATDKKVEAGGAYYIISRSMGLAMGGTLGLALFVGLSFSISLYIIGFSESFLDYFEYGKDLATIRICGSIVLAALTAITFASTSLAIRTQYVILGLIVLSLASILAGSPDPMPTAIHLNPSEGSEPATVLFGIFFPAVTGFTAGVNMSGDLRDPQRAIPVGTILSIAVGLAVYVGLAVFLAARVDPVELMTNDQLLLDIAWSRRAVVGGIWGATISSALGSILGAPRILQALSLDHVTPRIFGIGHGKSHEPRYALILAFAIGEAGILIGELDAIARIVSVFFIATYGFLNLSASFEMIASPDFRPDFKIPKVVPVIGATTCAILMIWLDLLAMFGAVVVMALLFVVLKRRELQLETGDAWLGVWSSIVRFGLHRLTTESQHQRNWRPNILVFTHGDNRSRAQMLTFSHSLIRHRGVLTEIELQDDDLGGGVLVEEDVADVEADPTLIDLEGQPGYFTRPVPTTDEDLYDTMAAVCRFHGFSGLESNTVMLDWNEHAEQPAQLAEFLDLLGELDANVLCLADFEEQEISERPRIDLWWTARAGSFALNLALVRFMTAADVWRRADLRFMVVNDDPALTDSLHRSTTQRLHDARVEASVKVVNNTVERRPHAEWIERYSSDADLTIIGIPHEGVAPSDIEGLDQLVKELRTVLLVRASSQFESGFSAAHVSTLPYEPTDERGTEEVELPPVELPGTPAIAEPARRFAADHMALVTDFTERGLHGAFGDVSTLLEGLRDAVDAQYQQFEVVIKGAGTRRRRRVFARGPESLLSTARDAVEEFERKGVPRQRARAERAVETLLLAVDHGVEDLPAQVLVTRIPDDFAAAEGDPPHLRRYKARHRAVARLLRRHIRYRLRPRPLARYYLRHETVLLALQALETAAGHGQLLAEELGRFLNVLKQSLATIQERSLAGELTAEFVAEERARLLVDLEDLWGRNDDAGGRQVRAVLRAAAELEQAFAVELDMLNLRRHVRRERRVPRAAIRNRERLVQAPRLWAEAQALFLERAALAPVIGTVQIRSAAAVHEAARAVRAGITEGLFAEYRALRAKVDGFRQQVDEGERPTSHEFAITADEPFDAIHIVDDLHQALQDATNQVSEVVQVMDEASIRQLGSDPFADVETVEVPLRRLLQFLIDAELVGPIREILADAPRAERRAITVGEDVLRLISFSLADLDEADASSGDDYQQIMSAVLDTGLARIDAELAALETLPQELVDRMQECVEGVVDRTDNFAVMGTAEVFAHHGRGYGASIRLSGFSRITQRVANELKEVLVTLSYRRSAGLLLARRMAANAAREPALVVDRVLALVDHNSPVPDVVDALPFYYGQLFLGQSAVHSAFWVGREAELAEIERAIGRYRRGFYGAVTVIGEPGAGKTALCEVAIERFLVDRPVFRIVPPAGGSCSRAAFTSVLRQELGLSGSPKELLDSLADGSVLVFHDAELWWERSTDGLAVIELLLELIERYGERFLFVIEMGVHAFRFVNRLVPLADQALAVVECGPVDAETLKDIVMLRHKSTGLRFELAGRDEEEIGEWALARLFTSHFDYSHGNIGAALRGWIAHVETFGDGVLEVRTPRYPDYDVLTALRTDWTALAVQLTLHRQVTLSRLVRITGLGKTKLRRQIDGLRRMGLVLQRKRNLVELAPRARNLVVRSLTQRGLLP